MLLYISGKVSKDSSFGKENWRDEFVSTISKLSGLRLSHLDPLAYENDKEYDPQFVFDKDCALINKADCVVVYLSDDISVGGSQEMMIAKYLNKPLIGLAPRGGKFNCDKKMVAGRNVDNFIDPFVFATCDVVCGSTEEVAEALKALPKPKGITIIDKGIVRFEKGNYN